MKNRKIGLIGLILVFALSLAPCALDPAFSQTYNKGLIGRQDFNNLDGTGQGTFSRKSSAGGTQTLFRVGNEVDVAALYCNDTSDFTDAKIDQAVAAVGASRKAAILLAPGTWTISANKDWTAYKNLSFKISAGALISHSTYTVKFPRLEAGLYQWNAGTGIVTINKADPGVFPEWWMENTTPGTTDMTAAVNSAILSGTNPVILQGETYLVNYIELVKETKILGKGYDHTVLKRSTSSTTGHFVRMKSGEVAAKLRLADLGINGNTVGTDLDGIHLGDETPGTTDFSLSSTIERVFIQNATGYAADIYFGVGLIQNSYFDNSKRGLRARGSGFFGYQINAEGNDYEDVIIQAHLSSVFGLQTGSTGAGYTNDRPTYPIVDVNANEVSIHHLLTSHDCQRLAAIRINTAGSLGFDFLGTQIYPNQTVLKPQYTIYDMRAGVNILNPGAGGDGIPYYSNHSAAVVAQLFDAKVSSQAQKFFSRTGLISVPTATPTTLYTLLDSEAGIFIAYSESNPTIRSVCYVGKKSTNVSIYALNQNVIALTVSGDDIQATHSAGVTISDIRYTFIKM